MRHTDSILRLALFTAFSIAWQALDVFAAQCHTSPSLSKSRFPNCKLLSPSYALHWSVSEQDGYITFGIEADATGWVGLGLSEQGGMFGADILAVEKGVQGKWVVNDYFSEKPGIPVRDEGQHHVLVEEPKVEGGKSVVVVRRPLETCDEKDRSIMKGLKNYVIWAYGPGDTMSYHGPNTRGDTQIDFFAPADTKSSIPSDVQTLTFTMPNITVPAQDTSYMCTFFNISNEKKLHATAYEPVVGNQKAIHHMILFGCSGSLDDSMIGQVRECHTMVSQCERYMVAYGPGVRRTEMPSEAGFPIGGGGAEVPNYFALQIHYTNIEKKADIIDGSGFKLEYTPTLRQHDVGVLAVGQMNLNIPPGQPRFSATPNLCPSTCTKNIPHPLNIIDQVFHMHTLGRSIRTQHIRDGKELPTIARSYYDFNYQSSSPPHPRNKQILPGDSLITTCTFDSTSRNTTTKWGESTEEEMCVNFITYYPAVRMTGCMSMTPAPLAMCSGQEDLMRLQQKSGVNTSLPTEQLLPQLFSQAVKDGLVFPSTMPQFIPLNEIETCVPSVDISSMLSASQHNAATKTIPFFISTSQLIGMLAAVAGMFLNL
ncbi:hypothetical protein HK102_002360 [Quaeritorhiza haematococci]|nr:hypothetical protein HK102_002360 [Quaeritorhiza haematococci]